MHEKVSGLVIRQQTQSHAGDAVPPAVKCRMEQLPKNISSWGGVLVHVDGVPPAPSVLALLFPASCSSKWLHVAGCEHRNKGFCQTDELQAV